MGERGVGEPPSPTRADLRQLGWCLLLVYAVIALLAFLSRDYFGPRTALLVGLGLAAFVTAAFALITAVGLLASYGADAAERRRRRRARRPSGPEGGAR